MSQENLKDRITNSMKDAMRAREKERLGTIRLILAAIKQREIDERIALEDDEVLGLLDRMIKQRRESVQQFEAAGRQDLADKEKTEIGIIQEFMPAALTDGEVDGFILDAIDEVGATSMREMGKVMSALKPRIQGRVDMGAVSAKVRARLTGG